MPSLEAFLEKLAAFLAILKRETGPLPIAIETRNGNYLTDAYFRFLQEWQLIPVFSEKIYMPYVYDVYWMHRCFLQTDAVIRLLGGDRGEIEKKTGEQWNRIVEPKPDKDRILHMAADIAAAGHKVTINVNNHYEGSAPLTIEEMQRLLQQLDPDSMAYHGIAFF